MKITFHLKLGIKKILDRRITIKRGANADYTMGDIITMLMMGVLAGARHMSHLLFLKKDTVINTLFNWNLFSDQSTFGKLFKRFNQKHCQELSDVETETRKKVWTRKWFPRITLDMDSIVNGVVEFMKECFDRLPQQIGSVFVRSDSGFFR